MFTFKANDVAFDYAVTQCAVLKQTRRWSLDAAAAPVSETARTATSSCGELGEKLQEEDTYASTPGSKQLRNRVDQDVDGRHRFGYINPFVNGVKIATFGAEHDRRRAGGLHQRSVGPGVQAHFVESVTQVSLGRALYSSDKAVCLSPTKGSRFNRITTSPGEAGHELFHFGDDVLYFLDAILHCLAGLSANLDAE